MDHIRALAVKSLADGLPAVLVLSTLGRMNLGESVIVAIIMTFFAYIVGDLWVLPRSNNSMATTADAGLVFFVLWAFRAMGMTISWASVVSTSVALAAVEGLFFHSYLHREVKQDTILIPDDKQGPD